MSSGFATPITIKEAIDNIIDRTFLIPAIQRKFVWSSEQIEVLFDSIMHGYPINSFMLWEVKEEEIKNNFKFYQFLTDYRALFGEDNHDIDTKGYKNFKAIIDGQQRLTSLYIGLKGSYAYKLPRKWWYDNQDNIPTRHLYLNLSKALPEENEKQMKFDFQFLTELEYKQKLKHDIWFKVNQILEYSDINKLDSYIESNGWLSQKYTKETIRQLRKVVFEDKLINYYLETTQEIDTVLDIFIRTNSGGEPLSFSNLLMSITTANWQKYDARKEIPNIIKEVLNYGFLINEDFVLKTCLVIINDNIKFQVKNFNQEVVLKFEESWDRIRKSIIAAFQLLANFGFNNHSLRAKNAVIPIIFYTYHRAIEDEINKPNKYHDDKREIRQWLCISLLKGVFGGQSDNVLNIIKKVINLELNTHKSPTFPLDKIKEEFKADPVKNLSFDDAFIESILNTQKDDSDCFPILSLIYSHLNFENYQYHKDHLHPENYFKKIKQSDFQTIEDYQFYASPSNWNSILNLQLLNGILNQSKNDTPLKEWVEKNSVDKVNQIIPNIDLDITNFKSFIQNRKSMLIDKLKEIIS